MRIAPAQIRLVIAASAATLLIGALSETPSGQTSSAREPEGRPSECAKLTSLTFEGNTTITSATDVAGSLVVSPDTSVSDMPPFCRVQGVSKPSPDSNIMFEVWLPLRQNWNSRFLSAGEGGFAGVPNYTRKGLDGGLDELLRRGYATAGTDTGHRSNETWWAVGHPEKAADYLYRSKHLVTVAAKGLIAAYYGAPPSHSYFSSCSNGGRQGLIEVQRYPDDYDGVVVGAPWNFQSHSAAGFVWNQQVLSAPDAALPEAKLPALNAAALAACDAADGLKDGVIANPATCRFDPSVLKCKGPDAPSCLTEPQIAAIKKVYEGPKHPHSGMQIFPGFAIGGEAGWASIIRTSTTGSPLNAYFANIASENPKWDYRNFDFDVDVAAADAKIGRLGNAVAVDYSAATRRGVKIIQYHGWNDQTLQPAYSPAYYEQVARANGGMKATQNFYRLYMVPGMTHCYGGPGATSFGGVGQQIPPARDAQHDVQTAIEAWVEKGVAPENLIATKYTDDLAATRTLKLTRPLCLYPTTPRYKGTGDPNDAANFACVP